MKLSMFPFTVPSKSIGIEKLILLFLLNPEDIWFKSFWLSKAKKMDVNFSFQITVIYI